MGLDPIGLPAFGRQLGRVGLAQAVWVDALGDSRARPGARTSCGRTAAEGGPWRGCKRVGAGARSRAMAAARSRRRSRSPPPGRSPRCGPGCPCRAALGCCPRRRRHRPASGQGTRPPQTAAIEHHDERAVSQAGGGARGRGAHERVGLIRREELGGAALAAVVTGATCEARSRSGARRRKRQRKGRYVRMDAAPQCEGVPVGGFSRRLEAVLQIVQQLALITSGLLQHVGSRPSHTSLCGTEESCRLALDRATGRGWRCSSQLARCLGSRSRHLRMARLRDPRRARCNDRDRGRCRYLPLARIEQVATGDFAMK